MCNQSLGKFNSILLRSAAAIQKPFPVLFDLNLRSNEDWVSALSDLFLGGSAPRLRSIRLYSITFPEIRNLLSSTSDLIHLGLWDIPDSGYISPEMMIMSLSSLTQLKTLRLGFRSRLGLESRHPSPQTRVFLLNLTHFYFHGVSGYLEELVAHIDTPILHSFGTTLFNGPSFDISELPQFVNRSEKLRSLNTVETDLAFVEESVELALFIQTETADDIMLALSISCSESFWLPLSLSHVFSSSLPPLATSKRLDIRVEGCRSELLSQLQKNRWLDLFRPFTTVKYLYLSEEVALHVATALEEVAVLPSLQNTFFEGLQPTGHVQEAIRQFASTRQPSNHPIAVHRWERRQ